MARVFLSMGSNLGNRSEALKNAILQISNTVGSLTRCSSVYETESWGYQGNNFLNMVIEVETNQVPGYLLDKLIKIEASMGRQKGATTYKDRTIDLDILMYDQKIIKSQELSIPHPHLQERLFVLIPFVEIAPDIEHPVLKKTIRDLLDECTDKNWVKCFGKINLKEV